MGAVDEHVDSAEAFDGVVHGRSNVGSDRDVAEERLGLDAALRDFDGGRSRAFVLYVGEGDVGAFGSERERDPAPEPLRSTRDERGAPGEPAPSARHTRSAA